jgi:hypothetical protein
MSISRPSALKGGVVQNIDNLWKYDMPSAWRLLYSLKTEEIEIVAIILEWLDHKNYERRFGYKTR